MVLILIFKYRNEETLELRPTNRTIAADMGLRHHQDVAKISASLRRKEVFVTIKTVDPNEPTKLKQPLQYFFLYDLDSATEMAENGSKKITQQVRDDLNCAKEKLRPRNVLRYPPGP
jgi:hypothetical protein